MNDEGKLERLRMHLADAKGREFYSIQRIDLLVISVSGAGVYLVFETLKFLLTEEILVDRTALMAGGICFVVAILLNFACQWAGYYTNKHEACWAQYEHKRQCKEPITSEEDQVQCRHDTLAKIYSWWLRVLNIASTITMLIGVVLIAFFNLRVLPAAA